MTPSNALAMLRLVVQLVPIVTEAITAVESALPQGGQGAAKLALIRQWIETAVGDAQMVAGIWPSIQATIDQVVAVKNAVGEFSRSTAAVPQ